MTHRQISDDAVSVMLDSLGITNKVVRRLACQMVYNAARTKRAGQGMEASYQSETYPLAHLLQVEQLSANYMLVNELV